MQMYRGPNANSEHSIVRAKMIQLILIDKNKATKKK